MHGVGHQSPLALPSSRSHDGRVRIAGWATSTASISPNFHPEAPHLHLMIVRPQIFEGA